MSQLTIGLDLVTLPDDIVKEILRQCADMMDTAMSNAIPKIRQVVQQHISEMIRISPAYTSLISGTLREELGVVDASRVLNQIIETISANIQVDVEKPYAKGNSINGGFTISILRSDFADIVNLPGAEYVSKSGSVVPWLHWLLFAGTTPVITGYKIKMDVATAGSRTGPIMIKSKENWSVPAEFAGTQEDNFLTKALDPLRTELEDIIVKEIEARIH
jgi:hypothetical protein